MAMIKCPECGQDISDKAQKCVNCGHPLEHIENKTKKCPECGKDIDNNAVECPFCGCPIEENIRENNISYNKNKKKPYGKIMAIGAAIIVIIAIAFSLGGNEETDIKKVTEIYMNEMVKGNLEESQMYLEKEYNYSDNPFLLVKDLESFKNYISKFQFKIKSVEEDKKKEIATVELEVQHPDPEELIQAQIDAITLYMEDDALKKAFDEKLESEDLGTVTENAFLDLVKVDKEWKIKINNNFEMLLGFGKNAESSPEIITENEEKLNEQQKYIEENIELVDFTVKEYESYSGKAPGIADISIKNNGDKDIVSLKLQLDFLSETGEILDSKNMVILGSFDEPIKAGYSWKMEDGRFFEIENLNDSVNLEKVDVWICDAQLEKGQKTTSVKSEEEQYIEDYLELTNYKVEMCESYTKRCPGLLNISVKNNGDRDVAKVTVTVFFQDENGNNVAEDSFMVIGNIFDSDILKANYSWKMESGKFYELNNLADDIDISRYTVEITDIAFE